MSCGMAEEPLSLSFSSLPPIPPLSSSSLFSKTSEESLECVLFGGMRAIVRSRQVVRRYALIRRRDDVYDGSFEVRYQ